MDPEKKESREISAPLFLLLCLAWLLPGLIGHEPWKPDEGYSFGLVNHIYESGDWVVPTLAGEPFMEKPPLYYITASLCERIFSPFLPLHDAARLASSFYVVLMLLFFGLCGRELQGRDEGWIAVLLLIGCVGLLDRTHKLITDVALLAGLAMALYGLAVCQRRPNLGGLWTGTGLGVCFLSKGLLGPGLIVLIAICLPAFFESWRRRSHAQCLLVALGAALPWLVIWPVALYRRSPQLFMDWFWTNNLGRFFGFSNIGPGRDSLYYVANLPWIAWPALPFALWTLWWEKFPGLKKPAIQFSLTAFLVMFIVLSAAFASREVYAMPMLLPLSLLGAMSARTPGPGLTKALHRVGIAGCALLVALLWLGWVVLMSGTPTFLARRIAEWSPGYQPTFDLAVFAPAMISSVLWLAWVKNRNRFQPSLVINWSAGLSLVWMLVMTIWLPWLDAGKSYRAMMESMKGSMPERHNSMASEGLGESQRALLEYYAGVKPRLVKVGGETDCDLFLRQERVDDRYPPLGEKWENIWEGHRPGDSVEIYTLYQRRKDRGAKAE